MRRLLSSATVLTLASLAGRAYGGGYEIPDNGTEALARGAAFTAKADDATAVEYNVAGLARQRGTRLLLDVNLAFHTYDFQRAGNYPVDNRPEASAYAGQPYPKVSNQGGVFTTPFLGVSTDFGRLDRWTFAFAVYGPPSVGNTNYGFTTNGLPGPQRYDLVKADLLIVYPTLAAAVRATKWLDLGVAVQLVVAHFDLANIAFTDLGSNLCLYAEDARCDAQTEVETDGITATVSVGAMFHPLPSLAIGLNLRPPIDVDTTGTVHSTAPASMPVATVPSDAEFHSHLPLELRLGLRYIFLKDQFEVGDIELDGVYQAWALAEGTGDTLKINALSIRGDDGQPIDLFTDIHPTVAHNYRDTFSVRLGGAYNLRLPTGVLIFRAGGYFDSSATHYADTRMDFDTMSKWAVTAGLGFRVRGVTLNVAYAYIWSPDRDVTNGRLLPINPAMHGQGISFAGTPLPAVNNGHYHAETQILSVGFQIAWDELLKKNRVLRYE